MSATTIARGKVPMDLTAAVAVAITVLGWASSFPAIRAGLHGFGPVELGALRFAIAAIPAAIFLAIKRPAMPLRNEWWRFACGGVVSIALYTAMLNIGEQTVSAGAASFIINVAPILTAFMAVPLLGERFPALAWVGTFVSFIGIGIIALGEGQGFGVDHGALLILGSAFCTAVGTIVQKPLFARHRPLTVATSNMVIGALCLSPFLAGSLAQAATADTASLAAVIYLGIVPGLIAYGSWAVALSRMPAGRASNFLYCVPPMATLMGFLWLGEVPTPLGIIGGALALAGVVMVNLRR
jgi:drug/metabolite transporter (DMT)-like permease